jgi:hypothetical protein
MLLLDSRSLLLALGLGLLCASAASSQPNAVANPSRNGTGEIERKDMFGFRMVETKDDVRKMDIFGFRIGMTQPAIDNLIMSHKLKCNLPKVSCVGGDIGSGELILLKAVNLSPPLLRQIKFSFKFDGDPVEQFNSVQKQYGGSCVSKPDLMWVQCQLGDGVIMEFARSSNPLYIRFELELKSPRLNELDFNSAVERQNPMNPPRTF